MFSQAFFFFLHIVSIVDRSPVYEGTNTLNLSHCLFRLEPNSCYVISEMFELLCLQYLCSTHSLLAFKTFLLL